jgi:carboxyl-terminal processing protease
VTRAGTRSIRAAGHVVRALTLAAALATALAAAVAPAAHAQSALPAAPADSGRFVASYDSVVAAVTRTYYDTAFVRARWLPAADAWRVRAVRAQTPAAFRAAVGGLLGTVPASHFYLIPADAARAVAIGPDGRGGEANDRTADAGLVLRVADGRFVAWQVDAGGPAARRGLRPGDVVRRVGPHRLDPALRRVLALPDAPAQRRALTELTAAANALLAGPAGSAVVVRITRRAAGSRADGTWTAGAGSGDAHDDGRVRLVRRAAPGPVVQFGGLPPLRPRVWHRPAAVPRPDGATDSTRVGVIGFDVWLPTVLPAIDAAVDALRGCDALVLDLRGNPGGVAHMVAGVAGHLLDTAASLGTLRDRTTTLRFVANPRRATADGRTVRPFAGPVAVLVDGLTASTSEIFAGGLQALGRVRVFGEPSAGQALLAHTRRLPTGDVLVHAVADLAGPDGRRLEGAGVVPDVHVPLRRADLARGADAPLAAALRWAAAAAPRPRGAGRCGSAGPTASRLMGV